VNDVSDEQTARRNARALRWLAVHEVAFALVILPLNILNISQGAPWWAFWPSMSWGIVLMVHVFIVKAMTIDEEWVDDRAMILREHSYDFDHMKDIERRIVESDTSIVPRDEREGPPKRDD
jgi:hypothetical protein